MLAIEYDVDIVALVNAVDEDGEDPTGEAWLARRRSHEDGGMARGRPEDVARLEATEDTKGLRSLIERIVLEDRASKEAPQ
jgi:hypothetical protein